MKVYLDNCATTRVDSSVIEAMTPFFDAKYGNPSSVHTMGLEARDAVENARKIIGDSMGAKENGIVFTSGGTESDNLAIMGVVGPFRKGHFRGNIITSPIEHSAVIEPCKQLEEERFKIKYVGVDREGFINPKDVAEAIDQETLLVSIMHANNEIGTIQPIEEIGRICRENNVIFHTDAVQSFTKVPFNASALNADLISVSSHKIHGPKGVGALYVREGVKLQGQMRGGGHEFGIRAGTENVPGIVGFGKAVEISRQDDNKNMGKLRDYLIDSILDGIDGSHLHGPRKKRLSNNINMGFGGVNGGSLLTHLDLRGIFVSTGSACSSGTGSPSRVLKAIGLTDNQANSSIRASLSRMNTREECDYFINALKDLVPKLRSIQKNY